MFSQPIDEVSCYHRLTLSKAGADESLTRYQKENGFAFLGGGLGIARLAMPPRNLATDEA